MGRPDPDPVVVRRREGSQSQITIHVVGIPSPQLGGLVSRRYEVGDQNGAARYRIGGALKVLSAAAGCKNASDNGGKYGCLHGATALSACVIQRETLPRNIAIPFHTRLTGS